MPLTAIASPRAVRLAYSELVKQLKRGATRVRKTEVRWQGGSTIADVYWRLDHRFWFLPSGADDVYPHRLRFGLQNPLRHKDVKLVSIFNFADSTFGRRRGGLFATDSVSLNKCLLHSGAIGGGIRGVNRSAFLASCSSRSRKTVAFAGRPAIEAVMVGQLRADDLAGGIGAFVRRVAKFKDDPRYKRAMG